MRFLLNTTSTNPDSTGRCDYARIEVTPEYANRILRRHALFLGLAREDDLVCEVSFRDSSVDYFERCEALDALQDGWESQGKPNLLDEDGWVLLDDELPIPEEAFQRTECDRLVVAKEHVRWCSIPRHRDFSVSTASVSIGEIERNASAEPSRA